MRTSRGQQQAADDAGGAVKDWSLMYDVKLILKTILVLFSKKAGAA